MAAPNADVMRPERFSGANFRRWQSRAKLWLNDLKLFWVISSPKPLPVESEDAVRHWDEANTSAIGRLLAVLSDTLFDTYRSYTVAAELWKELEDKYSATDYGNESFLVEKYMTFQMVESRSIVEQAHEVQLMVKDLGQYDTDLPEKFQVNVLLAKLPASWRDFGTALRRRREVITITEFVSQLNVEEQSRKSVAAGSSVQADVNVAEVKKKPQGMPKKNNNFIPKKTTQFKRNLQDIECYVCGKTGHTARFCRDRKGSKPRGGNQQGQQVVANFFNGEPDNSGFQHSSPA
ncbi:hypothetical protein ACQ4PT_041378 [Festuca glaucescens]